MSYNYVQFYQVLSGSNSPATAVTRSFAADTSYRPYKIRIINSFLGNIAIQLDTLHDTDDFFVIPGNNLRLYDFVVGYTLDDGTKRSRFTQIRDYLASGTFGIYAYFVLEIAPVDPAIL